MKTLYLSEFKKHLGTGHLRTRFEYFEPRAIAPNVAWGSIQNEIITNGSRFQNLALFYHWKGDPSRIEVYPFLEGGSLGDEIGFHVLSDDGDDADQDDIDRTVLDVRPDMSEFDISILGSEKQGVVCIVDRDIPKTYCLQRARQPDLVFDGVIRSWWCEDQTWSNWTRWINQIKYATTRGTFVTLREHTLIYDGTRIRTKRWIDEVHCEAEADDLLHDDGTDAAAEEVQEERSPVSIAFCPLGRTDKPARKYVYLSAPMQKQP